MKITCVKEYLEKAALIAERFTGKNVTLPILSSLLIESTNRTITVTATNLEYAIQITIPGKVHKDGKLCLPAKILTSLLQSIKEEKIDLEERQGNALFTTDSRESRVNGLSPEDFPLVPKIKKERGFAISIDSLSQGLEKVIPSAASSEFKPELSGIYCGLSPSSLKIAATDTFRLGEETIVLKDKVTESFSFILPQKVAQELTRLPSSPEQLTITIGDNQVLIENEHYRIISRLVDGKFPEYGAIIPKTFETTSFINRHDFIDAIRASSIFASKVQEITVGFKGKGIEITAKNPDVGEHKITIPSSTTGKDAVVSFNYRYLLDGMGALNEEEFFFGCNGAASPSLIHDKSGGSFLYVVMPIRLP